MVLLIVAAIDSIRNLPASALFGSQITFFFLFAAIIFLLPVAFAAAELSALFPDKGGVYYWVKEAFGEKMGMLAIWLQWINTMVWYPTILSFIVGTFLYLIHPDIVNNKLFLIAFILILFWGLTFVNLFGIQISAKINSFCALIGTIFPMVLIVVLAGIWIFQGSPIQFSFTGNGLLPSFTHPQDWATLIAIMSSFLGMELAGVHVSDIKDPQRNFPKALFISAFIILTTMLLGSLSIAVVIPANEINLVSGVMQFFDTFFSNYNLHWPSRVLLILIVIGTTGSTINWLISPAKGLLQAGQYGFLPPFLAKTNQYKVASRILVLQAIFVSLLCLLFFLVPSVNAFYWFLTTLSTELYMIMYVLMFLATLRLHYVIKKRPHTFKIPGKHVGIWIVSILGLFGSLLTIFVGFFPPSHIEIASPFSYMLMIGIGNLVMIAPVSLFYLYKNRTSKKRLIKR